MQIDIIDNQIIIKSVSNNRLRSMLHLWDYDINDKQCVKELSSHNDIDKLIKYCIEKNIEHTSSTEVDELIESRKTFTDGFEDLRSQMQNYKNAIYEKALFLDFKNNVTNLIKPSRQLRDHQFKAAYHLYQIRKGANFSVPGAGKTTVVLTVYELLKSQGLVDTLFVIGPTTCFFSWISEFKEVVGLKGLIYF